LTKNERNVGQPWKPQEFPAKSKSAENKESQDPLVEKDPIFGAVQEQPNGDVVLPAGMLETIEKSFKKLSERCNLKKEVHLLKASMYSNFIVKKEKPIYDPTKFKAFCKSVGSTYNFYHIMAAVTDKRHSPNKILLNELRTATIIYKMCYSLSQQCNAMQIDQSLYLDSSNINKEGIETQHQLGDTCSIKTTDRVMTVLAEQHYMCNKK
ncbi:Hypothetical predicted protein, partial [Paramuricea clavata]